MGRKKPMPPEIRVEVFSRANYMCEIMSRESECTGRAEHAHHRKLRSQGGKHTVANIVGICHKCHDFVHGHPAIAYTNGWLVKSTRDPREVPFNRRGGFIMLTEDGGFEQATTEPLDA